MWRLHKFICHIAIFLLSHQHSRPLLTDNSLSWFLKNWRIFLRALLGLDHIEPVTARSKGVGLAIFQPDPLSFTLVVQWNHAAIDLGRSCLFSRPWYGFCSKSIGPESLEENGRLHLGVKRKSPQPDSFP